MVVGEFYARKFKIAIVTAARSLSEPHEKAKEEVCLDFAIPLSPSEYGREAWRQGRGGDAPISLAMQLARWLDTHARESRGLSKGRWG